MTNGIYEIYKNEIDKIIKDENTESVFLVGSSKNLDLNNTNIKINDIDIFVFVKRGKLQVREIKGIEGIEFDINYFSKDVRQNLIDAREYFFLKEMSEPKIIYDKTESVVDIINLCKEKLRQGPKILSKEEKCFIKNEIKSKVDRLKQKHKLDEFEYEFLTNIYLKDIIVAYFIINNKWIPKDKNLLKELKTENLKLFNLIQKVQKNYRYEDLLNVYEYIFKNIGVSKNIKITY
ncbi:hypothetical protein [Romboutsia sp.]|uniref:hypothetical protein n=1 Tax=Romboutsia sp. TaxID=1965302 RepID=UPI002BE31D68|nr:hypothetical protein [Romboutsia sp.]HSQ89066.1 hypothetical protein [Romboutsia sp.]